MLRTRIALCAAVAAAALLASTASLAQGGLGPRLDAAEQKLTQDESSCQPIDLGEYVRLLNEAALNKKRAAKAAKAGAPVNQAQVDADLAKASALFNRAQAALVQQCIRSAQQAQPPAQPPQQMPQQGAMNLSPAKQQMLDAHNRLRAAFGAPPLQWSPVLTEHAATRAQELKRARELVHAPREGRGTERENIVMAPANYTPLQIFERWARERNDFVPGIFPNVCKSGGQCSGILHLSQILWPDTTEVGCFFTEGGGYSYGVCRYNPGGNKDGKPVGLPVQIAENSTIRARQVGGDYTGGSQVASPPPENGRTASLFDLGIYGGGAYTTEWFDIGDDPVPKPRNGAWYVGGDFGGMIMEDVGFDFGLQPTIPSTPLEQLTHEYGYDGGLFVGYDLGAFRIESEVAYRKADLESYSTNIVLPSEENVDTAVEQPKLPGSEVFNPPAKISAYQKHIQAHWEAVMKMAEGTPYEKTVSNLMVGYATYVEGKWSCNQALQQAGKGQVDAALAALKEMKSQMSETGNFAAADVEEIDTLIGDYESLMQYHDPQDASPSGANAPAPDPAAPALPATEVFNPADWPQCPMDVM